MGNHIIFLDLIKIHFTFSMQSVIHLESNPRLVAVTLFSYVFYILLTFLCMIMLAEYEQKKKQKYSWNTQITHREWRRDSRPLTKQKNKTNKKTGILQWGLSITSTLTMSRETDKQKKILAINLKRNINRPWNKH